MNVTFLDTKILVFTKPPLAGKCKSRLVPVLGEEGAAQLQARLLQKIITDLLAFNLCSFEIWQSETSTYFTDLFRQQKLKIPVCTQQGATLGERMSNAMQKTLQDVTNVIIIGSDCILYSQSYIKSAIVSLNTAPFVIGPAADGGYVLIGASQHAPEIFEDVSWGTNRVLEETLLKMQRSGINYTILDELWDIDEPIDLDKLKKHAPELLDINL